MNTQAELLRLYEDSVGSVTDGLTGVYSHGIFQAFLGEDCNRCHRYGEGFSLALIDVDFLQTNEDRGNSVSTRVSCYISSVQHAEAFHALRLLVLVGVFVLLGPRKRNNGASPKKAPI